MKQELLIIIPAYNEEKNIGDFLQKMKSSGIELIADILVINDGSTDDTKRVVMESGVEIMNKPLNMGYGSTLQLGYKYASRNNYRYIIQIDGDGQHDVSNIEAIYNTLRNNTGEIKKCPDIVIGSRFLSEKNGMKISWLKSIAIGFFKKTIRFFTGENITDPTSGLQGLNRDAFTNYAEYGNFDYRYPDINMIMQMIMRGYKIQEIPAQMHERSEGKSMHSGIIKPIKYMVLMFLSTISIIIRQRKKYYKLRKDKMDGEIQNG